jgi:hypothetical protein
MGSQEMRHELGKIAGFYHKQRTRKYGKPIPFRNSELAALVNYLRFREDTKPEPVRKHVTKIELKEELAERCGFDWGTGILQKRELHAALEHFQEVDSSV